MNISVKSPDETRRKLLRAGLKIFGTTGFGSAKLEDIAAEAGVTRGAISWHFKNKKALYREMLIDCSTEKFNAVFIIYNSGEPPVKTLEMLIDYHIAFVDEFHLIVSAMSFLTPEKHDDIEDVFRFIDLKFRDYFAVHSELIQRGVRDGVFRSDIDPDFQSRAFYSCLWGLYINRQRFFGSFDADMLRIKCREQILLSYLKPGYDADCS